MRVRHAGRQVDSPLVAILIVLWSVWSWSWITAASWTAVTATSTISASTATSGSTTWHIRTSVSAAILSVVLLLLRCLLLLLLLGITRSESPLTATWSIVAAICAWATRLWLTCWPTGTVYTRPKRTFSIATTTAALLVSSISLWLSRFLRLLTTAILSLISALIAVIVRVATVAVLSSRSSLSSGTFLVILFVASALLRLLLTALIAAISTSGRLLIVVLLLASTTVIPWTIRSSSARLLVARRSALLFATTLVARLRIGIVLATADRVAAGCLTTRITGSSFVGCVLGANNWLAIGSSHVGRLVALLALNDVKFDFLILSDALLVLFRIVFDDCTLMDEDVFVRVITVDESVAIFDIEPLDYTRYFGN